MIRLNSTTRKLQAVLGGVVTTNQLPISASYSDHTSSAYDNGASVVNTNSTTAVDVVAAPAASTIRDIDYLSVYNRDTADATISFIYNDNATEYVLISVTLSAGDKLEYIHGSGWKTTDSSGRIKVPVGSGGGGSSLPVADTTAIVMGSADDTKLLRFEVDGFTTGVTRVLTPPDANATLAGINIEQEWTAQQVPFDGTLTDGATIDWDGDTNGQVVSVTTTASRTFNAPTNIQPNALYKLVLTTGGYTPSWNAAFKWPDGTAPSGLTGVCILTFIGGASNVMYSDGVQIDVR